MIIVSISYCIIGVMFLDNNNNNNNNDEWHTTKNKNKNKQNWYFYSIHWTILILSIDAFILGE